MVSRLFQIVYLLMEKNNRTALELSKRLEVSERTIYRDVDKLSEAGIPIYTNRGKFGGISLLPGYVLDKTVLTPEDKAKLFEALQTLGAVGYAEEKQALDRLQSFFGNVGQEWIEVDFSAWGGGREEAERFRQIKYAICGHVYIAIRYSGADGETMERLVKPLKLCFKGQAWYLYGYCELRADYRFFKLSRISALELKEEHFAPEKVEKLFTEENAEGRKSFYYQEKIKVLLEINPKIAYRAYDELPNVTRGENGMLYCEMEVEVEDPESFLGYLLTYGSYIQVIRPEKMRKLIRERIKELGKLYSGGPAEGTTDQKGSD